MSLREILSEYWYAFQQGLFPKLKGGLALKRGQPRKGEEQAKEPSQLERQPTMSLLQLLADLPRACDVGTERNATGHTVSWNCTNADPTMVTIRSAPIVVHGRRC